MPYFGEFITGEVREQGQKEEPRLLDPGPSDAANPINRLACRFAPLQASRVWSLLLAANVADLAHYSRGAPSQVVEFTGLAHFQVERLFYPERKGARLTA